MKSIGIFDVIGPNMIGPSSSHTAGALRIALLARKFFKGAIVSADFTLYGSFATTYKGHGTDRALVAGILGFETDDPRIRDSFVRAEKAGIVVAIYVDTDNREVHPNTVDIHMRSELGEDYTIRGVSTGGGHVEIRMIDGIEIKLTGEFCTIFIRQKDEPGVLAHIAGILSDNHINIAFMRLYRENRRKNAYTIIEADDIISQSAVQGIEAHPAIYGAVLIQ